MIMGECPHCDAPQWNPIADVPLPVYEKIECPDCGETYWLKHSRIDPVSYPEKPENCGAKQA